MPAPYVHVATFFTAGEVPQGPPLQTFRHDLTAVSTLAPVFTHPQQANGTIRVEMTPDVDMHYAIGSAPVADASVAFSQVSGSSQQDPAVANTATRFATAGVTFYLWAIAGQRLAVRTEQA